MRYTPPKSRGDFEVDLPGGPVTIGGIDVLAEAMGLPADEQTLRDLLDWLFT